MTHPAGNIEGWYSPWPGSPELVLYVKGVPLGEVYPISAYELDGEWQARIMPHVGNAYSTQNEAMLFLEAIAALGV
jgi:hypothetical protein